MVCQCRFILGLKKKKATILVNDVDNGGDKNVEGPESLWGFSVLSFQFKKLNLKNKIITML